MSSATIGSPPAGDGVTKRKAAACVHCHRRKVRCDSHIVGTPCTKCQSSGRVDCRIHEKKKKSGAVRSVLDPVPIRCRPFSASTSPSNPLAPSLNLAQHDNTPTTVQINQHDQSSSGDQDSHSDLDRRLVKIIDEEESGKREIQRGVRALYVGHDVSNISFLIRQQRDKDGDVLHFAANEIPKQRLQTGQDQLLADALTLPEKALADELVEAYFVHVNPGYPVIDEDWFMALYRNRDPSDPPPILLLQAILLVGSHILHSNKTERDSLKDTFFRRTKWLFDSRIERNRDIVVQAALLMTWHSESTDDDVSANAYYWVGIAARIATGLGMHRNTFASTFTPRDRRMWRRLWYITLQFDVMVSLSYGRPQAINLEDSDVAPLSPADFVGCGPRVRIDFVIRFTELCTMISYIVRERFGLRVNAERRKTLLLDADEALASWSLKLPDSLRLRASNMDPWSAMLHLTYNNFLILLHRPHPRASAYSDDYGPHDAEICSAAAGVITSIFEELRLNNRLKDVWFSGVHTLFTAMIQVRVELRFSNPVLAINALGRFDSASGSLRELAKYWTHAGTILRLFENSKRLQEDLLIAMSERPKQYNNNQKGANKGTNATPASTTTTNKSSHGSRQHTTYDLPTPNTSHLQQPTSLRGQHSQQYDNWDMRTNPSADKNEPFSDVASVEGMEQPREFLDWRQLFSFANPDQPLPMTIEGFPELEDEWRQLYWQETPMSDILQDGGWINS